MLGNRMILCRVCLPRQGSRGRGQVTDAHSSNQVFGEICKLKCDDDVEGPGFARHLYRSIKMMSRDEEKRCLYLRLKFYLTGYWRHLASQYSPSIYRKIGLPVINDISTLIKLGSTGISDLNRPM